MREAPDLFHMELRGLPYEELLEAALFIQDEGRELKERETANERIYTEAHILYKRLQEDFDTLKAEHEQLKLLYQKEVDKNILKTRTTYGRSTEKLLSLIDSASDKPEDFEDESQDEDTNESGKKGRIVSFPEGKDKDDRGSGHDTGGKKKNGSRKNSLKRSLENLPREILYLLNIDELNNEYGEGNWRIAFWRQHISVERIPVSYYAKYTYTPVISNGLEHNLYTIPFSNLLLPHSYASASMIADILYRKFLLGLPFNRQAVDYRMSGIQLSKQTIIHWVNAIVPGLLEQIREHMALYMIRHGYIQSDESYLQVNKDEEGACHKGFIWVHCTSELLGCHPVAVFYYEPTRSTDHLRRLLWEFVGYITCDAYISYKVFEDENGNITVTGCFMHCRRYFAEALFVNDIASLDDEELAELPEIRALLLIREIYAAENTLRDMSPEERLCERKRIVEPKVNAFFDYVRYLLESGQALSERLSKAIQYALNQEKKLREFLNDGSIPIDNGKSERLFRAYSIGRANWLFADTIKGANVNAVMYSIVETARANEADVRIYIQYLLDRISAEMDRCDDFSEEFLDSMMPWSIEYREYEDSTRKSAMNSFKNLFPEPERPKTPLKGIGRMIRHGPQIADSA